MSTALDLFDGPVAPYAKDSPTSRAAAKAIGPELGELHRRVLLAFGRHGAMTPDACASAIELHWIKIRPRCSQLTQPEWGCVLEDAGEVGLSALGNPMAVLRLTERGQRVVDALHRAANGAGTSRAAANEKEFGVS